MGRGAFRGPLGSVRPGGRLPRLRRLSRDARQCPPQHGGGSCGHRTTRNRWRRRIDHAPPPGRQSVPRGRRPGRPGGALVLRGGVRSAAALRTGAARRQPGRGRHAPRLARRRRGRRPDRRGIDGAAATDYVGVVGGPDRPALLLRHGRGVRRGPTHPERAIPGRRRPPASSSCRRVSASRCPSTWQATRTAACASTSAPASGFEGSLRRPPRSDRRSAPPDRCPRTASRRRGMLAPRPPNRAAFPTRGRRPSR